MANQLNKQPLAELVREISSERISGALRLEHKRAKAVVYFEEGTIIYAASNVSELRLESYLKKSGLVSEKQLSSLPRKRSDLALIAALSENNAIEQKQVQPLITQQVADVLRVALLWAEGTWEFDKQARLGEEVRVVLNTTSLLMETARKMGLNFVSSRFPNPEEIVSRLAGMPDFEGLLPAEGFVLSRVESAMSVKELIALSGLRELDAWRAIYGLALSGFIQREEWPASLHELGRKVLAKPPTESEVGVFSAADVSGAGEVAGQTSEDELAAFFARVDEATTYYDVLNVAATSSAEEIKISYYALARLYHPDRFHLLASASVHARIESAFARIAQAYETLSDPASRLNYDSKLAAQERTRQFAQFAPRPREKAADADVPDEAKTFAANEENRAEDNFKEGFAALQQGQGKVAITHLAAAARLLPKEPRYRAYYGRALASLAETRRLAEAELQAAITLDPSNASYRVMLAELYFDLGFFRRAEGEIERTISMDPNNTAARKLIRRLERARMSR
jgi:tetratricopeptide (TPR) repeat protein